MRPFRLTGPASPASGALRGLRAGVLAVLCVLLPLTGHVLSRCHAPRWMVVAAIAAVAVPAAAVLTRRRLTDTQVAGALTAAQITSHLAYTLPGACHAAWAEHGPDASPPTGILLAGHLITMLLTARLLGVTEQLLWQAASLPTVVRRLLLLLLLRPLLRCPHGTTGPRVHARENTTPLRSTVPARLPEGRAPPPRERAPFPLLRPLPTGGLLLP
ncbi:hypothetical protein ABZ016_10885 [Streptomyces sp. NPDC006372]|uniref:hypothetical protein n=1 Tax=Streptomyces sp. NPDC006372 TaxID=3155599 RepID=UPI0033BCD6F1